MNSEEIRKAIESNSNYWEKRALENKLNIVENEEDYVKRISAIYDQANKDIEDKLAKVYARYAKENGLTLDEAYKKLPKAMETQYRKDVMDYISKAKEDSTKWRSYLLNQSLMHNHSVLDQLRTEYRKVVYDIDMEETGGKFLEKIYTTSNYYAQYSSNNDEPFAKVSKDKIQALLKENWSGGGNFSELIWKDKEKLVKALDDIVIKGLATGENFDKMADKLAKRMDTSKSNAKRLIMTESARMDNEGLLAYYKETEVKKLIFVATLDRRTSDICRAMDGEIFDIEDAKIGLNVPPLHPYCRSVISPYYEDNVSDTRVYRDKDTNKSTKGKNRTYKEYLEEELGNKEQAEALVSTKNTLRNLTKAIQINSPTVSYSIPDKSISDITGYEIDRDYLEWTKRRNARDIEHYEEKGEITAEELDKLFKEIKKLMEDPNNEVAIRVKLEDLEEILKSGKIVNGFEINKIHNFIEARRRETEKDLFGIPEDAKSNVRPIYGYLSNEELENGMTGVKVAMYGDIKIVLDNKVKKNSTITIGDSLDKSSLVYPSKLTDMKLYSGYIGDYLDIKENGLRGLYTYPEIQIFGGIKLKDIYRIEIPKKYKTTELSKLLSRKGIKVEWK